ncbi:MAG: hypothetical protein BEN19_04000 [Epulopiscium sp. Nuni2H_MBin003]|nr:MAG: hypothetical protein BEN19_04000 [Epulopiscium sp. Nuni2H_MBin003]
MIRKTFSFTDEDVIEKLDNLPKQNQSKYIQNLVKRDIYNQDGNTEFETGVKTAIYAMEECLDLIQDTLEKNK